MGHQEIDIRITEWLGTEKAQSVLDRVAREVSNSALFRKLSPVFLMKDPFGDYAPGDLVQDIRSELALFIAEHSSDLRGVLTSENRQPYPGEKRGY